MSQKKHQHFIIGTAGHVDHGKTELIRALTGSDTDRLKEEKARGISIDLGFAPFRLPGGEIAGIVDVPGHERFISNMLAGVGGIDLVLLVIDVMEGVMPQTHEHLQILELLEISRGIIVLNKCDLAEEDWIDIVEEEVWDEVAGTFLEEAPVCRVSAITKDGIPELVETIRTLLKSIVAKDSDGPLRLPVDRHFTIHGFGTVVTGTLLAGTVNIGNTVEVLPPGEKARVREIQVHDKKVEQGFAGQRIALNLAGLDRDLIQRGSVVGTPGIFELTSRVDVRLTLLSDAPRSLKFRDPLHFHLGTARVVGVAALLDRETLEPGESALVQIHLDRPLVAHRRDRFIIRSYSPVTTIGGGLVIDPNPIKHRRFREDVMKTLKELESGEMSFLLQKISDQDGARLKDLELISGMGRERIEQHLKTLQQEEKVSLLGDQWVSQETLRAWRFLLREDVARFHRETPLLFGIPHATLKQVLPKGVSQKAFDRLLANVVEAGELIQKGDVVHLPDFAPKPTEKESLYIDRLEALYREAGSLAKNKREMLEQLGMTQEQADPCLSYLFASGRMVKLNEESFLHRESYCQAIRLLVDHFAVSETLTLAEFRDKFGSARKQTQSVLEYFDSLKYTMRRGDARVAWKLPALEKGALD